MITTAAVIVACAIGAVEHIQILEFSSENCGPCRQMAATVERLNQAGHEIQQIDVDRRSDLADAFSVRQIPCFLAIHDNQVVDRLVGVASYQELAEFCRRARSADATARDPVVRGQVDQSKSGGTILDRLRNRGLFPGSDSRPIGNPFARGDYNDTSGAATCAAGESCQNESPTLPPVGPPGSVGPPTVITDGPRMSAAVHPDFTNGLPPASTLQNQTPPYPTTVPQALGVSTGLRTPAADPAVSRAIPTGTSNTADVAVSRALQATVRLRIEDDQGQSFGTGTIIDVHQEEALVLTCGHIFRAANGAGRIVCDFFVEGTAPAEGKLICYDIRRDVGLVSVRPNVTIAPVHVGGNGQQPQRSDEVFSVGCNHGESPTVNKNRIIAVNRYHGPANLVVGGRPVDGRSGGGLFATDGTLIGVCNAADQAEDEGLYAALGPIHAELDRAGLAFIYQPKTPLLASGPRANSSGDVAPSRFVSDGSGTVANAVSEIPTGSQSRQPQTGAVNDAGSHSAISTGSGYSDNQSTVERSGDSDELICIVRSRDGGSGKNRMFVIDRPSADLVQQLSREINQRGQHATTGMQVPTPNAHARSDGEWRTNP